MRWPKWGLAGLVVLAFVAFWMLLAGPDEILGIDLGGFGIGLAALVAWSAIHGISVAPRGELEEVVSPAEWKAWIGLAFSLLVSGYLISKGQLIASVSDPRDLSRIGRNFVLLMIAWTVVSQMLERRWKGHVLEDERDREIAVRANTWGRGATVVAVVGIALMLGLSPAERLEWATHLAIAHMLVFSLVLGGVVEYAVNALSHWRDRRA